MRRGAGDGGTDMIRLEREYANGNGRRVRVVVEIDDDGAALEKAILRLANKARGSKTGKVTALDGAVRVSVAEDGEPCKQCAEASCWS